MTATLPYIEAAMLHAIINGEVPKYFRASDFAFHESKAVPTASLLVKAGFATHAEAESALSDLVQRELIQAVKDPHTTQDYFLSEGMGGSLQIMLPNGPTFFEQYAARGPALLQEILTKIHREENPNSISDEPKNIPEGGLDLPFGGALGLGTPTQSNDGHNEFGFSSDSQPFGSGTFRSATVNVSNAPEPVAEIVVPFASASDRDVPLNHNSLNYQNFTTALTIAETAIIESNEIGAADPALKEEATAYLRAIRELITPQRIAYATVTTFIVPTLYKVADKVSDYLSDAIFQSLIKFAKILFGLM